MSIRKAAISDLEIVKNIVEKTISEVYPLYYPKGAVEYFLAHHNVNNIAEDIRSARVFICFDTGCAVGTVTVKINEICRLFVLPEFQGMGFGRELLDFAEKRIFTEYGRITLDASLPAKSVYLKKGYTETGYHTLKTDSGEFLCYDVMEKTN